MTGQNTIVISPKRSDINFTIFLFQPYIFGVYGGWGYDQFKIKKSMRYLALSFGMDEGVGGLSYP